MSVVEQSLKLSKEKFEHLWKNNIQEINLFIFPSLDADNCRKNDNIHVFTQKRKRAIQVLDGITLSLFHLSPTNA